MAHTDWRMKGDWIKNCNCAYGCPCDFNAPPTNGACTGVAGMRIAEGYFGEVRLDGLSFLALVYFPGPLHEGNGTMQAIIDERATPEQRNALFAILSGDNSEEGTMFHIFTLIVAKNLSPIFAPIEFDFDLEARTARIVVPGVLETTSQPIKNPVTGAPHRIQVVMPEGFEHHGAEVAHASLSSSAGIQFEIETGHSTLAHVEYAPFGVAA